MSSKKRIAATKFPGQRKPEKTVGDLGKVLPNSGNSADRICWRFTHVDHDGPWGLAKLSPAEMEYLLKKLADVEKQTVREIFNQSADLGKHYETHDLPSKAAQERLVELQLSDMTRISRLRFKGKERLFGFLVDNVFHVVWWDPEHEIWPSQKRNT
ncbi:hypothetical protein [Kitasatospora sp. NPDC127116]|uniref:hypothetical protein n=1 Tax=Kitasatospora sp. NPDC127116 TaxID=3345367 RepID=UPI003632D1C1